MRLKIKRKKVNGKVKYGNIKTNRNLQITEKKSNFAFDFCVMNGFVYYLYVGVKI